MLMMGGDKQPNVQGRLYDAAIRAEIMIMPWGVSAKATTFWSVY